MGKGSKPRTPPPAPPPVATTSADSGRRAIEARRKKKKSYGFADTLLGGQTPTGFTAQDLDPRG